MNSFESVAKVYSETVDTKPIHIYYERPHTWSLLPNTLQHSLILDLGCGSGWYAEQLTLAGAKVTAIDSSSTMVELTKKRLKGEGRIFVANLEEPLNSLETNSFDIVLAPLVIHYINNWTLLFAEIARVLKAGGLFIFSTHQPHTAYQNFNLKNYYETTLITDYWHGIKSEVKYYHHSLHELFTHLANHGFIIERILEPTPLPELKQADPTMYEKISTKPWFLFIRAKKI